MEVPAWSCPGYGLLRTGGCGRLHGHLQRSLIIVTFILSWWMKSSGRGLSVEFQFYEMDLGHKRLHGFHSPILFDDPKLRSVVWYGEVIIHTFLFFSKRFTTCSCAMPNTLLMDQSFMWSPISRFIRFSHTLSFEFPCALQIILPKSVVLRSTDIHCSKIFPYLNTFFTHYS